ncbi:MAG: peptidoglycan DD-metalloendopeptidase family protein [Candidatus Margulisiibacteriota bacterium]
MKRALALIFLLSLFSLSFSEVVLDEQQKLKQIQEQLQAQKQKLLETRKKEQESLSKLVTIKVELKKTTHDLNRAKTKIVENVGQIKELSSQIDEAKESLTQKTEKLKKRAREVYKSSAVNYLDLLFSTKSMSDFINRAYFFGRIIDGDAKLIADVTGQYRQFNTKKTKLVGVTEEIKDLAKEIGEKRQEIAVKAEEEKSLFEDLKDRREDYEKKVAELEKSSEELTRIIQAKMAQRKKAGIYARGSGAIDWPIRGRITSVFGYRRDPFWRGRHMHTGIDIAAPYGEVIRAADSGQVIFSGWWDGYGKAVVIDHGKNISTVYGHMSRIYVQADNTVSKGQIIGLIGSTGNSTGPHLHFEVRVNGKPTNPKKYLP